MKQGTPGTYGNESLPNITAVINSESNTGIAYQASGAMYLKNSATVCGGTAPGYYSTVQFDASRSSSTYKSSAKVNPDNAEVMYVIKF